MCFSKNSAIVLALLIMVASVFVACKKIDAMRPPGKVIFYPKPYFPLYPGSSWVYVDSLGNDVVKQTLPEYMPFVYVQKFNRYGSIVNEPMDTFYMPVFDGLYYSGYERVRTIGASMDHSRNNPKVVFQKYFSEELNNTFFETIIYTSDRINGTVHVSYLYNVVAKNIQIQNPYLGVIDSCVVLNIRMPRKRPYAYNDYQYLDTIRVTEYYAKNIGLVRQLVRYRNHTDTIHALELKSYHIND
jgi:hypothetical protein